MLAHANWATVAVERGSLKVATPHRLRSMFALPVKSTHHHLAYRPGVPLIRQTIGPLACHI